jgi:hypothetical protein
MVHLLGSDLGDLPVLAEPAIDVAARCGQREGVCAGEKVEEGLFLDRVDVDRAGFAVNKGVICAVYVFPDATIPPFLISEFALARAEDALDLSVGFLIIITGFDVRQVGFFAEGIKVAAEGEKRGTGAQNNPRASRSFKKITPFHYVSLLSAHFSLFRFLPQ